MSVGDIHIRGLGGWPLCGSPGPVGGYTVTSPECRDCASIEWARRQGEPDRLEPGRPGTVRIVGGENGWGLSQDAQIVAEAFQAAGYERVHEGSAAVLVHLERVQPHLLRRARANIVIPNPEWWCPVGNVGVTDLNHAIRDPSVTVWAKTKDAEEIFHRFEARQVLRIGFRSQDRMDENVARERAFLHVAGVGPNKRTAELVSRWQPNWPPLTVTCELGLTGVPANVRVICERLTDEALRTIQNRHTFHIYPSRYEGFGHAQWEALSCGAIVFTTDGPPFDEHAHAFQLLSSRVNGGPEWNPLVSWREVSDIAISEAAHSAVFMSEDEIRSRRTRARRAWEGAQNHFTHRIRSAISMIAP